MNQMFRPTDQKPARQPDQQSSLAGAIIAAGHEDWHGRINRAIASETAWKRTAWSAMGLAALLTCSNVWFAARSHLQIMHIVHDQLGETLGVYAEDGETVGVLGGSSVSSEPTQPELAYALKQWVRDVREVSIDINHEKRAIQHAFDLVARGSQADGMLNAYYAGHQPYQLATRETVNTTDMAAVAPPPADIGKDGLQTWRLQWTEQTVGRDGTLLSVTQQFMTITFTVIPPHGEQDAIRDPNGIHINSFATSEK